MSNQGQAQEPTMEEILASIRRIISEDSGAEEPAQAAGEAAPPPPPAPEPEPEPELEDDILELTEALPEDPALEEPAFEEPVPEPQPAAAYMPEPAPEPEPELIDDIQFAE